jgi:regulator of protease activity HflC (stomatin/prohibitin superfamily)
MDNIWLVPVVVVVLFILANALRVVKQYEKGVVLRFGKLHKVKEPGLRLIFPWIDRMTKIPLRVVTMEVPSQEIVTKDNVSAKVSAVVFFKVIDAEKAFIEVEEYLKATFQIAQTTLRSALGKADLNDLLSERDKLNEELQTTVDSLTEPWGIKVTAVEIKDVELTEQLTRAMAKVPEAERERKAKVVHAEGEKEASLKLSEAAHILSTEPVALQLRYLQTLVEIAAEKNSTIIFPIPIDLIKTLTDLMEKKTK